MKYLIILCFLFITAFVNAQNVIELSASEAHDIILDLNPDNASLIDGRTEAMYNEGHIANAVNINAFFTDVNDKLKPYLSRKQLVVYCTNQNRSLKLIDALESLNYAGEVIFITDGITGWKTSGYGLVVPEKLIVENEIGVKEPTGKLTPIVQVFGTAAYDVKNELYGYSFGRAHLGFQYQFNNDWSAKMIIDRGRPTSLDNISVIDSAGNMLNVIYSSKEGSYYTMWLKFASLRWQVNDRLSLIGGALLQNHYITQERFWGLRYVAQTFQDMYWHIPSSDLGFRANYKLNDVFSIDAALTNGEGPRVKQDAFGKVKYAAGLNINPGDKFQSRIYYHMRTSVDNSSIEQMASVFAGYQFSDKFRLGGEFNYMNNLNNASGTDSYGFSVYSAYQVIINTQIFIRYDRLLNETDNTAAYKMPNGNSLIGGVSYSPLKGINLSLNYQAWLSDAENNTAQNNILLSMEYKF
ncbi:MAG: rhodanese-like domain-containing protein [Bacteroidales bacterium]|nr:rhodanese-like domain-containing protein [Bacteroidales bacterium]